jgi:hypothetical protein
MLLGLLSTRVTNRGAIVGFLLGLSTGLGLYLFLYHLLPQDELVAGWGIVWDPQHEELCVGSTRLKMEVVLFAINTLVTLAGTLLVSALWPIDSAQRRRVEHFHRRLATPIGDLDEDSTPTPGNAAVTSPLRVVGVATVCIGLMLLGVLPWSTTALAFGLDLCLGVGLVVAGGCALWWHRDMPQTQVETGTAPVE